MHAIVAGAVVALGLATVVHAQDQGVKQVQEVIKKSNATVKSIVETKLQIQKTMDAYNLVVATGTADRKSAYSKLKKEMETTEKKRADVTKRADEANVEVDALVKSWNASTEAISDPALRAKSEQRLADSRARFADIRAANQKAGELYGSFMKTMQDHVTFLGHDLNDSAVATLKEETEKLKAQATELYTAIDEATAKANTNIAALSPKA